LIAGLIALAGLVLAPGGGASRIVRINSAITIDARHIGHFVGEVRAGAYQPCERRRRVVLHQVVAPGPGPDLVVGSDLTDTAGKWSVRPHGSPATSRAHFYATLDDRSRRAAGVDYLCEAARSPSIKLGQVAIPAK
jgi:hypothetical protein